MIRLVAAALLLASCSGESSFCADWLDGGSAERRALLKEQLERDGTGYRPPHVQYANCVIGFVIDHGDAIGAACRSYGDLEAGVTLGRLVAHGMEACAELRHAPLR